MNLNWFLSRTVRHATHMQKHVWKILCAQRDLLSPQAIEKVTESVGQIKKACSSTTDKKVLVEQMTNLETVANKWLKPYPNPGWRENIEVLLVAIVVAMGIRTFFVQPFKIPTGSMQPTLYGITQENLIGRSDEKAPNWLSGLFNYWFNGVSYQHVVAKSDGLLSGLDQPPMRFLLFNLWQNFEIGGETHSPACRPSSRPSPGAP
jgi:signal peptidase I